MKRWSVWLATLAIVGLCLAWVQSGVTADEPRPADPAPRDADKRKNADSLQPDTAVHAFRAALKAQNLDRLAEATALHAPSEAKSKKNQKLFMAILDQSLSDAALARLASEFDGFTIVDSTPPMARRAVFTLMKPGPNGSQFKRTVATRRETAGWKIVDFSEPEKLDKPIPPAQPKP